MSGDSEQSSPQTWDMLDDKLLQNCRVWDLRERRYRHPSNGKEGDFYYINSRDWAVVVARTVTGEIVLVRQFRWGIDALSWELPGGIIDTGEIKKLPEECPKWIKKGFLSIQYMIHFPLLLPNLN